MDEQQEQNITAPVPEERPLLTMDGAISNILVNLPHRGQVAFELVVSRKGFWKITKFQEIADNQVGCPPEDEDSDDENDGNPFEINFPQVSSTNLKNYTG